MKSKKRAIKAYKKAYNREWYKANKMYKDTYHRIYKKARTAESEEKATQFAIANMVLVSDRRERVSRGSWIDERTGKAYVGIEV